MGQVEARVEDCDGDVRAGRQRPGVGGVDAKAATQPPLLTQAGVIGQAGGEREARGGQQVTGGEGQQQEGGQGRPKETTKHKRGP